MLETGVEEDEQDSRAGDFEEYEDDEQLSLGSDASKVAKLDGKIDKLAPTWTEQYNEYKCRQGYQARLEDAELPGELDNDMIYQDTKKKHQEQLKATEDREKRAVRRLELEKLREQIIEKREVAKLAESEAQLQMMKQQFERRQK